MTVINIPDNIPHSTQEVAPRLPFQLQILSDHKLMHRANEVEVGEALDILSFLRPVKYKLSQDVDPLQEDRFGFIAQESLEILNDTTDQGMVVYPLEVIPLLVKHSQTMIKSNDQVHSRISEVDRKVDMAMKAAAQAEERVSLTWVSLSSAKEEMATLINTSIKEQGDHFEGRYNSMLNTIEVLDKSVNDLVRDMKNVLEEYVGEEEQGSSYLLYVVAALLIAALSVTAYIYTR